MQIQIMLCTQWRWNLFLVLVRPIVCCFPHTD